MPTPTVGGSSAPGSPASSSRSGTIPAQAPASTPGPVSTPQRPSQDLVPRMFGDTLLTNRNSKQVDLSARSYPQCFILVAIIE